MVEIDDVNSRLGYSVSFSHLLFVSRSRCAGITGEAVLYYYHYSSGVQSALKILISIDNI